MATALIIGIGSSGLHIIEEAQQFYYELTGKNKPDGVEYFYIETDKNQKSKNTASGSTSIEGIFMSLKNNEATIRRLKKVESEYNKWIPSSTTVLDSEDGAGGMSSYGRLALWGNYANIKTHIRNKYQAIGGDSNTLIFIVGTLTGGTGSGICVDMPYIVRNCTNGNSNIYGLFLAPNRGEVDDETKSPLYINYFNAIASISKYSTLGNEFQTEWPGAGVYNEKRPPYNQIQLVSQDFENANASLLNVKSLYRIAGLGLLVRLLGLDKTDQNNNPIETFSDVYKKRMVDIKSHYSEFKYSTFGITLIQYPKSQIEELFSINLSESMINRWLNPTDYKDNTGKVYSISGYLLQLKNETSKEWSKSLEECFEDLSGKNAPNGNTYNQAIKEISKNIKSKDFKGKPTAKAYILDLFRSNNSDNYYKSISNYNIEIRDSLIRSIQKLIVDSLEKFQNINITEEKINYVITSIDDVIKYWKDKCEITNNSDSWNKILDKKIGELFSSRGTYKICFQDEEFLTEQFFDIFTLLKMHISIDVLNSIKDSLKHPSSYLQTHDNKTIELPSLKRVASFKNLLKDVLSNQNSKPSLQARKADIENDLTNNTSQIIRLFEYGSLKNDIETAKNKYENGNVKLTSKSITKGQEIWSFLLNREDRVYNDFITESMYFVKSKQLVSNISIDVLINKIKPSDPQHALIKDYIEGNQQKIISKLPGMLALNNNLYQFQPHNCLKTHLLTGNLLNIKALFTYKGNGTDESVELPELSNAIVLYQEYGYVGDGGTNVLHPLVHIGINKTIVTNLIKGKKAQEGEKLYYEKQVPYISKKEIETEEQNILNLK